MRSFFSPKATKADERAFEDLFADPLLAPGARGDSMQDFSAGGLAYRAQGEAGSSAAHAALPSPMLQSQEASGRGNYFSDNSPKSDGHEVTVVLSRFSNAGEQGLGLVIDANFCISQLLPGCAAEANGEIRVGDVLLAVDGIELQIGDNVRALFPVAESRFELRLLRTGTPKPQLGQISPSLSSSTPNSSELAYRRHLARRREKAGKFDATRPGPVFQEVVWNEYCVLFPDGSSMPFNDQVRYTALTGYLRKKSVVRDGRADFAISHGESVRGWVRHFFHLSMKQLAWFDQDPGERRELRMSMKDKSLPFAARLSRRVTAFKSEHGKGKGVGSALLYAAPCRLYVSRLSPNEFGLSFGGGSLIMLQAANGVDAQNWVVAIASCLFFSSAAFESVLNECATFFHAAPKTIPDRLSPIEALDTVRAMGRECTYDQVLQVADEVIEEGAHGWFGVREFTHLVRMVCKTADPRSELLRAFRLLDPAPGGSDAARIDVSALREAMQQAGVPDEHVLTMVLAAAGTDSDTGAISYLRLADALYPAAATAAKRKRTPVTDDPAVEAEARLLWEAERPRLAEQAFAAAEAGRAPPVLVSLMPRDRVDTGAGVGLLDGDFGAPAPAARGSSLDLERVEVAAARGRARGGDGSTNISRLPLANVTKQLTPRSSVIQKNIARQSASAGGASAGGATPRTIQARVSERVARAKMRSIQAGPVPGAKLPTRGPASKALEAMMARKEPPAGLPPASALGLAPPRRESSDTLFGT